MTLIRKKKISQLPLLESATENTYVHVIDGDENYKIEADKLTAAGVSKTYVDQQDTLKVDRVEGSSLIPDTEIDKLAEYPEFEDLEFSHENLTNKNEEAAFRHVDERINGIPASAGVATYTLLSRRQNLITGTLPNGVNSTLILPSIVAGERNEVILHFKTNAVAAPTLVYSGFTPGWLNGSAISMKINKQYTIVFEQINGIVKTSWGEY